MNNVIKTVLGGGAAGGAADATKEAILDTIPARYKTLASRVLDAIWSRIMLDKEDSNSVIYPDFTKGSSITKLLLYALGASNKAPSDYYSYFRDLLITAGAAKSKWVKLFDK